MPGGSKGPLILWHMEVLIVCPANCTTGGPEALHAFASGLNKMDGIHARLWSWNITSYPPQPAEYAAYGCEYVTDIPADFDGIIVYPEIWANHALDYPQYTRAVYWLGIDAYASWNLRDAGAFLADDSIIHIAQSAYAYDFLRRLRVSRLLMCTDLLNADFYAEYGEQERTNEVLYNPAKATPFQRRLMEACHGITFKPITGMTREQVIDAMHHAKLYIDFGKFPGRERMPREAILCGCCVVSSKIGAAAYYADFPHHYKFDSKDGHIWAIVNTIHYVLHNFDTCSGDFEIARMRLRAERDLVPEQVKEVADAFQYYHPGA